MDVLSSLTAEVNYEACCLLRSDVRRRVIPDTSSEHLYYEPGSPPLRDGLRLSEASDGKAVVGGAGSRAGCYAPLSGTEGNVSNGDPVRRRIVLP